MTCSRPPVGLEADLGWLPDLPSPKTHALALPPNSLPALRCFPSRYSAASAGLRMCQAGDTRSVTFGWNEGTTRGSAY